MSTQTSEQTLKIIVAGSVGSGKTTAINAVCNGQVSGTEAKATERDALHRKETTTVAMEYGVTYIDNKKIHLYGTPGQRRFDFMSVLLCKGAAGMIVMIDNGGINPLEELDYHLNQHRDFLMRNPAIIAVTHYDDTQTRTGLVDYHQYCAAKGFSIPIMRMDGRKKDDMERTLLRLLAQIDTKMQSFLAPVAVAA